MRRINGKLKNIKKLGEEETSFLEDLALDGTIELNKFFDNDYLSNSHTEDISFVELAILNDYLHDSYLGNHKDISVKSYGEVDTIGRISFGGPYEITGSFWFSCRFKGYDNDLILQTKSFLDNRGELVNQLQVTVKKGINEVKFEELVKLIKKISFNNSRYKGKCIKVKLQESRFRGIEIIDIEESANELILNETQRLWINHFISCVGRGRNLRVLMNGQPGCGKAQPLDAKILTPNGWSTMGNINIGDEVLTPEGKISKVIGVFPQGEKGIYEITTKDGRKVEACDEHLWKVFNGKKRGNKCLSIINTLDVKKELDKGNKRLKFPLVSESLLVSVEDEYLVIPPYLMGLLLGDGSFNKNSIKLSTSDEFIVDKVKSLIDNKHNLIYDSNYDYTLTRVEGKGYKRGEFGNKYVKEIRNLNLDDKRSDSKFIPEKYKNLSIKQTIELIQGLMDSDGTCSKGSYLSFCTVSPILAKDFQELIWRIGGVCKIKEKQSFYKYKDIKKKGKLSYNIGIRYKYPKKLFSLERKISMVTNNYQYKDSLKNNILSIKNIGKKEAKCIMIDDDNHLYVTNDYIVTHNTESIREIARKLIPNVTFIIPEFVSSDDLTLILEACEIFDNGVIIMDDIDLYLGSRENGSYTRLLGQFLSFFDGVKKRKISLLASTNDKGLVDKAAERPGRFNFTLDYSYLDAEQIVKVCQIHLPKSCQIKEVYDVLQGKINGKKVNITGAFIANLAENIIEMSEDNKKWGIKDTISLIEQSYKGFYSNQVEIETQSMGFNLK